MPARTPRGHSQYARQLFRVHGQRFQPKHPSIKPVREILKHHSFPEVTRVLQRCRVRGIPFADAVSLISTQGFSTVKEALNIQRLPLRQAIALCSRIRPERLHSLIELARASGVSLERLPALTHIPSFSSASAEQVRKIFDLHQKQSFPLWFATAITLGKCPQSKRLPKSVSRFFMQVFDQELVQHKKSQFELLPFWSPNISAEPDLVRNAQLVIGVKPAKPSARQAEVLARMHAGEFLPTHLQDCVGFVKCAIMHSPQGPVLVLTNIQNRKEFFELPSSEREKLKQWHYALVNALTKKAQKAGIALIAIPDKEIVRTKHVQAYSDFQPAEPALDQFYEAYPRKNGFTHTAQMELTEPTKGARLSIPVWLKHI